MPDRSADDFEAIRKSLAEIKSQEGERCPRAPDKSLYNCLRESGRCPSECPYYDQWIGPGKPEPQPDY